MSQAVYSDALASVLRTRASWESWDDLLSNALGAHPIAVAEVARERGIPLPRDAYDLEAAPFNSETPELHQLESEWYFDKITSEVLASTYLSAPSSIALGCPTVAREAAGKGRDRPLIDLSYGLVQRAQKWRMRPPITADLRIGIPAPHNGFDVVILDPPWHLDDMLIWLSRAAAICRVGGTIAMPLLRKLTKPGAERERETVLDLAERLGVVRLDEGVARYKTPRFEWEACRILGLSAPGDWRTADMLSIAVNTKREAALSRPGERYSAFVRHDIWRTWVVKGQVVKLRALPTRSSGDPIQTIGLALNGVLPSVSSRHARNEQIGIWTSRQRVAAVADPVRVANWLDAMARESATTPDSLVALLG